MNLKLIFLSFLAFSISFQTEKAYAQYGGLDYSFGGTGVIINSFDPASDAATCMAIQPDGKILIGGTTEAGGYGFFAARYLSSGVLDTTFGELGCVKTEFPASSSSSALCNAMAVQPDGRIILAGAHLNASIQSSYALARYNANGSLDTTFDHDGLVTTDFPESIFSQINAIVLQTDGKIVVAGVTGNSCKELSRISVARYNVDGSLDSTFGEVGRVLPLSVSSNTHSIQINGEGKILIAGSVNSSTSSSGIILRLNASGSLDSSFISTLSGNYFMCMGLQPDGKIVAAGYKAEGGEGHAFINRFNEDGTKDSGFDSSLTVKQFDDIFYSLALAPDGKIIAAGSSGTGTTTDFLIVRFNPDGSHDNSFGSGGAVLSSFYENNIAFACTIDGDGKILAAGYAALPLSHTDVALARYNTYTVGLNEELKGVDVSFYPNPTWSIVNVLLTNPQNTSLRLINLNGQVLKEEQFSGGDHQLDLSGYIEGVYVLEIGIGNQVYRKRILKLESQ